MDSSELARLVIDGENRSFDSLLIVRRASRDPDHGNIQPATDHVGDRPVGRTTLYVAVKRKAT